MGLTVACCQLLLDRGADPSVKDARGRSVKDVDSGGSITTYGTQHMRPRPRGVLLTRVFAQVHCAT